MTATETALYRFYSQAGSLLYVGITADIGARFTMHGGDKAWWACVSRITVEHHPTREQALAQERAAIETEHPRWNVVWNNRGWFFLSDACMDCLRAGQPYVYPPKRVVSEQGSMTTFAYECDAHHQWECAWATSGVMAVSKDGWPE